MFLEDIPFRDVMSGLSNPDTLLGDRVRMSKSRFLDAGYMVIDVDHKSVLDCQGAFSWHHLPKDVQERWSYTVGSL